MSLKAVRALSPDYHQLRVILGDRSMHKANETDGSGFVIKIEKSHLQ